MSKSRIKIHFFFEGSLEVKVPTRRDEKQRREEAKKGMESVRRKKVQAPKMWGKSQNFVFFQCFVGRGGPNCGATWPEEK